VLAANGDGGRPVIVVRQGGRAWLDGIAADIKGRAGLSFSSQGQRPSGRAGRGWGDGPDRRSLQGSRAFTRTGEALDVFSWLCRVANKDRGPLARPGIAAIGNRVDGPFEAKAKKDLMAVKGKPALAGNA
jgi:hypothetical protein